MRKQLEAAAMAATCDVPLATCDAPGKRNAAQAPAAAARAARRNIVPLKVMG